MGPGISGRFGRLSVVLALVASGLLAATAIVAATTRAVLAQPSAAALLTAKGPASPTDESAVPHYYGPAPNWANSPLTQPTATVTIAGAGSGAEATAQVDPVTGGITGIEMTAPGRGYRAGATTVTVNGSRGTPAVATASVNSAYGVVSAAVGAGGSGYGQLLATLTGGGGNGAVLAAQGGVDAVTLSGGGTGYTAPTVVFGLPDDPNGSLPTAHVAPEDLTAGGTITKVTMDSPGSGYVTAPVVHFLNALSNELLPGQTAAAGRASLRLTNLAVATPGSGYGAPPAVAITDPTGQGSGATGQAEIDTGAIFGITLNSPGDGYLTQGIKKFQDSLPGLCDPTADGSGCPAIQQGDPSMDDKFIPLAVPAAKTYSGEAADEYAIGLVQYRTRFSSDLPPTLARGYVQLSTDDVPGQRVPLYNELLNGDRQFTGYYGVTAPQWLGPVIAAAQGRPVRIVFRNLLPTGADGNLFLPVDTSMMGSGMGPSDAAGMGDMGDMAAAVDAGSVLDGVRNPACGQSPKPSMCYSENRATLHLHGGDTPWISDGTPDQWITPAGEDTAYPQGVSVQNVPDMTDASGAVECEAVDDGCQTFYYSNEDNARLMFYHDHAWGITRLNVYAGEAAGYVLSDDAETALINGGAIPGPADTVPLVVQDRTFTPDEAQLKLEDPTWDVASWGGKGSFWYEHVYMPTQNPGDPDGRNPYGRWAYGPWSAPQAANTAHGPIANPYYDPSCHLDQPSTWTYPSAPHCEPAQIPGTPNISAGMEQYNDTPIVNGVAYPTATLEPKSYRLRILNAANDRFFNFQWYLADPNQGDGTTEVALKPAALAAAQSDPNLSPTPVGANNSAYGPDWVQFGSEGGFLPAPAVIDGQQPITWITDPGAADAGDVDQHSLLMAPAERADVVVDFSRFAGQTLILYNDAPAAFPTADPRYDYYTGDPDRTSVGGAPTTLPGYGPNTRTIMQIKIAADVPAAPFDLAKLQRAFAHHADGSGAFESSQDPIIVGQGGYDSAYGTNFGVGADCSADPARQICDGLPRAADTNALAFNTLNSPTSQVGLPVARKVIQDDGSWDEFGRMSTNLGVEADASAAGDPDAPGNVIYGYIDPPTEMIDGTALPRGDVPTTPIASMADGTQIWRFSHDGADTHPMHFHLFDVQLLGRVTADNVVHPPDPNELGWKDTVRVSPRQDTIVALRPTVPVAPFEIPNSVRALDPALPGGSTVMFASVDPHGNRVTVPVANALINFGWEYVYHCHILSHEEMDMMRPVSLVLPPRAPSDLSTAVVDQGGAGRIQLTWMDNSINETSFIIQRSADNGGAWADVGTVQSPLDQPNTHGIRTFVDGGSDTSTRYLYRVVAANTVGYGGVFPTMTASSTSPAVSTDGTPPGPGAPNPGPANPGAANPGAANPGTANLGTSAPSIPNPGTANPGVGNPGVGNPGVGNAGVANLGTSAPSIPNPGAPNPGSTGVGGQAMGAHGMGAPGGGSGRDTTHGTRVKATATAMVEGHAAAMTVKVSPVKGANKVSGPVRLVDHGVTVAIGQIVGGSGKIRIPAGALPVGTHELTVEYAGRAGGAGRPSYDSSSAPARVLVLGKHR